MADSPKSHDFGYKTANRTKTDHMANSPQIDLTPPRFELFALGGNDVTWSIRLPFDATAGTHKLLLAATADGVAVEDGVFASGSGLTVGAFSSGVTPVTVVIPRAFTLTNRLTKLFFSYTIILSGVKRGYARGTFEIGGDISES